MVDFNEEGQNNTFQKLRKHEEEDYKKQLAQSQGVEFVDLALKSIQGQALRTLTKQQAKEAHLAPFHLVDKTLHIAFNSLGDEKAKEAIEELEKKGYTVKRYLTTKAGLEKAWDAYDDLSRASRTKGGAIKISEKNIEAIRQKITVVDDIKSYVDSLLKEDNRTKTSQLVEVILGGALAVKASDIHLEPEEKVVRIRYRLDGVLTAITDIDHSTYQSILSRIKLSSGMKLNVANEAQDGRFTIHTSDAEIEVRSSVIPGPYGDAVVMRVLDPRSIQVELGELGIHPYLLKLFREQIQKPNGMILNTGPTGSGKTTTLYSFLRDVNSPEVKILTIENPIEYHLEGIVQTQVDHTGGYDFLAGLRSALRQDPDVIMVGEIRDEETAGTAVNAALTGHLVFSTLHTNDAAGTFPRLIDLGIDEKLITSAVNMAMAQRLVRKLCEHCKKEVAIEGRNKEVVASVIEDLRTRNETYLEGVQTDRAWQPVGCEKCNNIGYKGRVGVFEAIVSDRSLEDALQKNPSIREIWEATKHQGIPTMKQDGVIKILEGVTSFEELGRVIDLS